MTVTLALAQSLSVDWLLAPAAGVAALQLGVRGSPPMSPFLNLTSLVRVPVALTATLTL